MASDGFVRVSRLRPCPVCGHDSWCGVSADGCRVVCMRVESDKPSKNGGHVHFVGPDQPRPFHLPPRQAKARLRPRARFAQLAAQAADDLTAEQAQQWADQLGVPVDALVAFGCGRLFRGGADCLATPMRDCNGNVVGIRLRKPDGFKFAVDGGHNGLFMVGLNGPGTLYVVEGLTDAMAMHAAGYWAVGRPDAKSAQEMVLEYVARATPARVCIVPDADDVGQSGAEKLAESMDHPDLRLLPSPPAKDVRAFLVEQGTEALRAWLAHAEEEAEPEPPKEAPHSTIAAAWRPWESGALSVRPPARKWLLRHRTKDGLPAAPGQGDGLLARGIAGMLTAAGGSGKTVAVLQLAVCLITGRPWFGHFEGPSHGDRCKVLLLLAEEDQQEAHRRVYNVCESLNLDANELTLVERDLLVLPLRGEVCALLAGDEAATTETTELLELRRRLEAGGPWMLVVLDPSSRLAGVDAEGSNVLATRWVQAAESLCKAPGDPTVMVVGHSSKVARTTGKADARGVTGQEDGYRWAGTLNGRGMAVEFMQTKSNYSRPMPEPLVLRRGDDGLLRLPSDAEMQAEESAAQADAVARVVAAAADAGEPLSGTGLAKLASIKKEAGLDACKRAVRAGKLVPSGGPTRRKYAVPEQTAAREPNGAADETGDGFSSAEHAARAHPDPMRTARAHGSAARAAEGSVPGTEGNQTEPNGPGARTRSRKGSPPGDPDHRPAPAPESPLLLATVPGVNGHPSPHYAHADPADDIAACWDQLFGGGGGA